MTKHVAVWIDHKEARVFSVHPDTAERATEVTVLAPLHHGRPTHNNGQEGVKEHPEEFRRFYHDVMLALHDTDELLIVGPSSAKLEFLRYVHTHDHALEGRVVGIETVDHPTDGQVVAFAKKYFIKHESMA